MFFYKQDTLKENENPGTTTDVSETNNLVENETNSKDKSYHTFLEELVVEKGKDENSGDRLLESEEILLIKDSSSARSLAKNQEITYRDKHPTNVLKIPRVETKLNIDYFWIGVTARF